jgi:uncharacterized protein YoxC
VSEEETDEDGHECSCAQESEQTMRDKFDIQVKKLAKLAQAIAASLMGNALRESLEKTQRQLEDANKDIASLNRDFQIQTASLKQEEKELQEWVSMKVTWVVTNFDSKVTDSYNLA